jgi:hypothetical protein
MIINWPVFAERLIFGLFGLALEKQRDQRQSEQASQARNELALALAGRMTDDELTEGDRS